MRAALALLARSRAGGLSSFLNGELAPSRPLGRPHKAAVEGEGEGDAPADPKRRGRPPRAATGAALVLPQPKRPRRAEVKPRAYEQVIRPDGTVKNKTGRVPKPPGPPKEPKRRGRPPGSPNRAKGCPKPPLSGAGPSPRIATKPGAKKAPVKKVLRREAFQMLTGDDQPPDQGLSFLDPAAASARPEPSALEYPIFATSRDDVPPGLAQPASAASRLPPAPSPLRAPKARADSVLAAVQDPELAYSHKNLAAAFEIFARTWSPASLESLELMRGGVLSRLKDPDPDGHVYRKNVRQITELMEWSRGVMRGRDRPRPAVRDRPSVMDTGLARSMIRFWKVDELEDGVVVFPYSGHPNMVDAILELPNIRRVIMIEECPEILQLYTDEWRAKHGDRLVHCVHEGYWWDAYQQLEQDGHLDGVQTVPWSQEHPSLFFACQLGLSRKGSNRRTDGFFMQVMECSLMRSWLFKYGRMRMGFTMSPELFEKATKPPGARYFAHTGGFSQLAATLTAPSSAAPRDLAPAALLEAPPISTAPGGARPRNRLDLDPFLFYPAAEQGNAPVPVLAVPKADIALKRSEYDALRYLMSNMFINSAKPWVQTIAYTAPGAAIIEQKLKEAGEPVDPSRSAQTLTSEEWIRIARAYDRWPFKPTSYETEFYDADSVERGRTFAPRGTW